MSHADLYNMRNSAPPDMQGMLAPMEHRAFAREAVQQNPLMALSLAVGIPVYQLAKILGIAPSRTPASMDQVTQGYAGILDGLKQ